MTERCRHRAGTSYAPLDYAPLDLREVWSGATAPEPADSAVRPCAERCLRGLRGRDSSDRRLHASYGCTSCCEVCSCVRTTQGLSTWLGVFVPALCTIFGVIVFAKMGVVVAQVLQCCTGLQRAVLPCKMSYRPSRRSG